MALLFLFLKCPGTLAGQTFCSNYNGARYKSNLISLAETLTEKLLSPFTVYFVYRVQGQSKTVPSSSLQQFTLLRSSVHGCFSGS
jgi:hypothetical protein